MSKSKGGCECALVILSREYAKVWEISPDQRSKSTTIYEPYISHGYAKSANKFLSGWAKHSLDPVFAEKIYRHLEGMEKISVVGAGKHREKTVRQFIDYLEGLHPEAANRVEILPIRGCSIGDTAKTR